jgi:hypothetical protein
MSHEDGEDDAQLLARVEEETRNIVGSYTRAEYEAYVAILPSNGHLNHVLEVAGVSYGPRPVGVFHMLAGEGCEHLLEIKSLALSFDASVLRDFPAEIGRIARKLVKNW